MGDVGLVGLDEQIVVYPSARARPVPSFMVSKPPGWVVTETPEALVTFLLPEPMDGVRVSASLIHERVIPTMTLEMAAKASWARLKAASPEATVEDQKMMTFGERTVYVRGTSIPATSDGPALGQVHAIFFGPGHEAATGDMFQIVSVGPQTQMDDLLPVFVGVVASFSFL
jgi:hypothetical protein